MQYSHTLNHERGAVSESGSRFFHDWARYCPLSHTQNDMSAKLVRCSIATSRRAIWGMSLCHM
ncbi:hypothetical protein [Adlercreutzia caecimuris]|uniref:hypothetical protein n=1 Tax=Adlercreutzia caecimuris TaxID=671266 RepID=UPI0003B68CA4|nr:hypothetical protein [Adlercreutzia caecimuris]